MARPWFGCEPVDESFFARAPVRMTARFEVARPATEVWGELTSERPLYWCRILQEVKWTSPWPFGVGTTRDVKALWGANNFREYYFRWEEGRQHSFYVVEATAPLASRFAEDYLVEPTSDDSCTFTWTIAYESRAAMKPGRAVNNRILTTLFSDTRKHYSAP